MRLWMLKQGKILNIYRSWPKTVFIQFIAFSQIYIIHTCIEGQVLSNSNCKQLVNDRWVIDGLYAKLLYDMEALIASFCCLMVGASG